MQIRNSSSFVYVYRQQNSFPNSYYKINVNWKFLDAISKYTPWLLAHASFHSSKTFPTFHVTFIEITNVDINNKPVYDNVFVNVANV